MGFSWIKVKENAIKVKVRRAKTMAKGNINPDFDKAHPDWVRDANKSTKDFTIMVKKVTEDAKKFQDLAFQRKMKYIDK